MRFKRYLDMGSKRSLRAVVAGESGTQVNTKEGKKLSDVSVPRAWRRASKLWRWVERAECYDLGQTENQAARIRKMVVDAPYASKAYRILRLDYLARLLIDQIKSGMDAKLCLAITARYQSIVQQIAREMEGLDGATLEACDAAALATIKQEMTEGKSKPRK